MTRQTSTSTVDTHTKVSDWISNEISKYSPRNVLKQNSFARKEKVSIGIDATPQARSNSILRQEPIEITKAKTSLDYGTCMGGGGGGKIICQEIDMDISMIDEVSFRGYPNEKHESDSSSCSSFSHCDECAIQHQHSYSDPVKMPYHQIGFPQQQQQTPQEEITSFIEEPQDVNVTSRDELCASNPLSPEESLRAIQKMNYPKVLPNYPENMQFNDSTKRRSLQIPPHYYQIHNDNTLDRDTSRPRPNPPPRMSSTLGRRPSKNGNDNSDFFMTQPLKAKEPPAAVNDPPEITSNTLIVGPIVPKCENIYMTMQRKKSISRQNSRAPHDGNQENPPPEINEHHNETKPEHLYAETIKNSRVQTPQDGIYSITASSSMNKHLERQDSNSPESSSSTSSSESSTGTIKKIN
jgi:hypothetical protein